MRTLLQLVKDNRGDRDAIIEAIRARFFATAAQEQTDPGKRLKQQQTRAYNALLGASKYGLVDLDEKALTKLGEELLSTSTDEELRRLLARHIIRDPNGLGVLQAVRQMHDRGDSINKQSLQDELEQRHGFKTLPRATVHHTRLRAWLRGDGRPAREGL